MDRNFVTVTLCRLQDHPQVEQRSTARITLTHVVA